MERKETQVMSQTMIDGIVKILLIVLTGIAQYYKLVPPGSLLPVVTLVAGYHAGQNIPSAITNFFTGKDNTSPPDNTTPPTRVRP